jgi:hypothetical protein
VLEKFSPRFFCNQDSILLIDYLSKGQTTNAAILISAGAIEGYFEGKTPRDVHQGGLALARQCPSSPDTFTKKKLAYLDFQCLDHLPRSPDLTPSDYHPFLGLKKQLKGRHFLPKRMALLPRRLGWTENILNFF